MICPYECSEDVIEKQEYKRFLDNWRTFIENRFYGKDNKKIRYLTDTLTVANEEMICKTGKFFTL